MRIDCGIDRHYCLKQNCRHAVQWISVLAALVVILECVL
jgi:hypothetical protein